MNLLPLSSVWLEFLCKSSSYTVSPINYHQVPLRLSTYLCLRGCLITMTVSLSHNPILLFLCVPLHLFGPLGACGLAGIYNITILLFRSLIPALCKVLHKQTRITSLPKTHSLQRKVFSAHIFPWMMFITSHPQLLLWVTLQGSFYDCFLILFVSLGFCPSSMTKSLFFFLQHESWNLYYRADIILAALQT